MDWVLDHAVGLSALALGVLVIVGVAVAAIRGIVLYRVARRAQRRVGEYVAVLSAEAERAQTAMARVTQEQADLAREVESLRARLALAQILARHAGRAVAVLRAPMRYLGR
ncbi:MAG: hypothetical protein AB1416_10795 [Actinomycetota bacterium]